MPSSGAGILVLVALIPGLVFLRITERVRKPSESTTLQELVEILAVGLLTTGVVIGTALLLWPADVVNLLSEDWSDSATTRHRVLAAGGAVLAAIGVAVALGLMRVYVADEKRYAPNVWETVLGETKAGHQRHVAFELEDGRTVDGELRAYTVMPGVDGGKQLALWGVIHVTKPGADARRIRTGYEYVVVEATAIRFLVMNHVPKP